MLNFVKIFNKIYISRFDLSNLPFIENIFKSNEVIENIIKTHGGFALFSEKNIYKITYNKNISHLYNNQLKFSQKVNKKYLINTESIHLSNNILITKEEKKDTLLDENLSFDNIFNLYRIVTKDFIVTEIIDKERFVQCNFSLLKNNKYKSKIDELLFEINSEVHLSLIHGDFWKDNILQTKENIYFIDYDRSSEYSFLEFDLINYFVFTKVYNEDKPSWSTFIKIIKELMKHDNIYIKLVSFIDKFYTMANIQNPNKLYTDQIIKLYIIRILYVNNSFLEGISYLKWYRHCKGIEKLLWY